MNNSPDMKIAMMLVVVVSMLSACAPLTAMSVRVHEVECKGKWTSEAKCEGSLLLGSDLEYVLNERTNSVALKVIRNNGDWFTSAVLYANCKIVDRENWGCGENVSDRHGIYGGKYERSSFGKFSSYRIVGITGYRYWWVHFTMSPGETTTL
jgi:hypothetical protein